MIRRLDHVAIAVADTARALEYFSGRLGLPVIAVDEPAAPRVRLTYLDAGNTYIQLVEPLDDQSAIAAHLTEHGEGLHHICFGVDDVAGCARALAVSAELEPTMGSGRGRSSAFVPGPVQFGTTIECTEFHAGDDVRDGTGSTAG